jgi:hypothetical protein
MMMNKLTAFAFLLFIDAVLITEMSCTTNDTSSSTVIPGVTVATPAIGLKSRYEALPTDVLKITPETDIYLPILHSGEYEEPVTLPYPVNTAGAEDSPFILDDGSTLYYFFTPDVRVPAEKQLLDGVTGIYVTQKTGDGWKEPERVVLNDDISLDGAEFAQDNIIWFASARAGYDGINWFTAEFIDGKWQDWEYAGDWFPASYEVGELHFTKDWTQLYFHSGRPGGKGGYDIWTTQLVDGQWQEPVNIEGVNSAESEGWPWVSQDGRELWFNRTYLGTPALFRSRQVDGKWTEPELMISRFAGEPTLDNKGNLYFVHHYYKDGIMLEADIYLAKKK